MRGFLLLSETLLPLRAMERKGYLACRKVIEGKDCAETLFSR